MPLLKPLQKDEIISSEKKLVILCHQQETEKVKPLSVTKNVVGLQTDDAGHVAAAVLANVSYVVGL